MAFLLEPYIITIQKKNSSSFDVRIQNCLRKVLHRISENLNILPKKYTLLEYVPIVIHISYCSGKFRIRRYIYS